ncbi:MAG: hypothetical protein AAF443_04820 [Chlamydiota bacterium]
MTISTDYYWSCTISENMKTLQKFNKSADSLCIDSEGRFYTRPNRSKCDKITNFFLSLLRVVNFDVKNKLKLELNDIKTQIAIPRQHLEGLITERKKKYIAELTAKGKEIDEKKVDVRVKKSIVAIDPQCTLALEDLLSLGKILCKAESLLKKIEGR